VALLFKRWWPRVTWWVLFVSCISIRWHHLDKAPAHNDTTDEYAWTWSGMTLIKDGVPIGWSNLSAYKRKREVVYWRDHKYNIVKPYLDHPPLYSLYAGAWIMAWGHRDMYDVDLWQMRTGTIPLAALSFILLTLVLRRLLSPAEVLTGLLFYSVMPLVVWHQRLVVSENMFVPMTLAGVLLLQQQRDKFSWWRTAGIALIGLLLPITKVAALSSSAFLVIWAFMSDPKRTRWVSASAIAVGTAIGIGAYFWYGRHVDPAVFKKVLTNHHDRFQGFGGMEILLFEPRLIATPIRDILSAFGCAVALGSLARPQSSPWGVAIFIYSACMAFFVNQKTVYGWYFIPLYPWLCTALGVYVVHASRHRLVGMSMLWCTVAGLSIAHVLHTEHRFEAEHIRIAYLAGVLALCGAWAAFPRFARESVPTINTLFVVGTAVVCLMQVFER
jgi:4-amino-4-deoxy-L-arabinose transferase-like glycosyltransferase